MESYRRIFEKYDAHLLWNEPYYGDSFTIVGVPGWYDFSFAPFELGFTREDFLKGYYGGYQWMDILYTDFRMSPEEVTLRNADMLKRQLERAKNPVIVLLHFVPLRDFLLYTGNPENDFWNAYGGSKIFGEIILGSNKNIKYVFFGHVDYKRLKTIELKLGVSYLEMLIYLKEYRQ